jgi:hypothetical protein
MSGKINVIAAVGLALGGALGMAGAMVTQQNVQSVRGEILSRQGHAEAASRTMAEAAAQLRALGMHWHAAQATRGLEPTVSLSRS